MGRAARGRTWLAAPLLVLGGCNALTGASDVTFGEEVIPDPTPFSRDASSPSRDGRVDEVEGDATVDVGPGCQKVVFHPRQVEAGPAEGTWGASTWTELDGAKGPGEGKTSVNLSLASTTSPRLTLFDFGVTVPDGVVIESVAVEIVRQASAANRVRDHLVLLRYSDDTTSEDRANVQAAWPAELTPERYEGPWGRTFQPADLRSEAFGVIVAVKGEGGPFSSTASIDEVSVQITYCR